MNFVVFDDSDVCADGLIRLGGERAKHVCEVLHASTGDTIRLAHVGGALHLGSTIRAVSAGGGEVLVAPGTASPPPARSPVDLALALPRPKCLRRLWPQIAAFGLRRVFVTAAEKVEKSYWGCTFLKPEIREGLMREGLAQAGDSTMPRVSIVRRLKPFLEDEVPALYPPESRFFAHPGDSGAGLAALLAATRARTAPALVAVGPEGGWSPFEIDMFTRCGFRAVSLGPRILRTDTAVVALLGIAETGNSSVRED